MSPRDLALIIVSWNVRQLLQGCLASVFQSLSESSRAGVALDTVIWLVDNHSADGTPLMVQERFPRVRLTINQENRGYAAANNQALEMALAERPRFLLLLNPDTTVRGRALETLVHFMEGTPSVGMAGARLVYGDGSFQHSGFHFPGLSQILVDLFPVPARLHNSRFNGRYPRNWYAAHAPPFPIDHPLGAAMMVRSQVIETVGMMDTSFFMYCEEIDWAMRVHAAGWNIYCVPAAEIVHFGGQSTTQIQAESLVHLWRSRHRLFCKHYSPTRVKLAGQLVRLAMKRGVRRAETEELENAYREILAIWK